MFVALVSAKGSPGVTTAALALTAAAGPGPRLVVEMDPSGGDLELFTGCHLPAGLPRVVAGLRHGVDPTRVLAEAVPVSGGVPAVMAQTSAHGAEATLVSGGERLGEALAGLDGLVVADAGRWSPSQRTASRIAVADLVGVVCQAMPSSVEHARWLAEELRTVVPGGAIVVPVGDRPHRPDELRAVFTVPVAAPLAVDRAGAAMLYRDATSRRYRFTMLARTAARVLGDLRAQVGEVSGAS